MDIKNKNSVTGSPYECSSHQVSLDQRSHSNRERRLSVPVVPYIKKHGRHSRILASPEKSVHKKARQKKVPNAPRPSLQLNGENVLFLHDESLIKSFNSPFSTPNQSEIEKNSEFQVGLLWNSPESNLGGRKSLGSAGVATSTPFVNLFPRRNSQEAVLSSALVGAPRLALNVSIHSSSEDASKTNQSTEAQEHSLSTEQSCGHMLGNQSVKNCLDTTVTATNVHQSFASVLHKPNCSQPRGMSLGPFRCRICLEDDGNEGLLSPCRCKGTVGLVHRRCLEKWLYTSGKPNCELCGYDYIMTPSHKKLTHSLSNILNRHNGRNFHEWLNQTTTKRHLLTDIVCLIVLIPAACFGTYCCALAAFGYAEINPLGWQVFGLWGLAVIILLLLTTWMTLAIRHHLSNYLRFRAYQLHLMQDETRRLAALPSWRFSIQPRPRGSSAFMHTGSNDQSLENEQFHAITVPPGDESLNLNLGTFTSNLGNVIEPNLTAPSQRITVSVALSTVPELIEENSTSYGRLLFPI